MYQRKLNKQIAGMKENKAFYEAEIEKLLKHQQELNSDQAQLEKYARERFLMKKEGETIFIVED